MPRAASTYSKASRQAMNSYFQHCPWLASGGYSYENEGDMLTVAKIDELHWR